MKLAEALVERADANRRLQELRSRIVRNAKHQEGEDPAEDPQELLREFEEVAASFERLVVRINRANNGIQLGNGLSMVEALARRDVLKLRHSLLKALAEEATPQENRYSKSEIRFVSSVVIRETQADADRLAREHRELDALIQGANWNTEI